MKMLLLFFFFYLSNTIVTFCSSGNSFKNYIKELQKEVEQGENYCTDFSDVFVQAGWKALQWMQEKKKIHCCESDPQPWMGVWFHMCIQQSISVVKKEKSYHLRWEEIDLVSQSREEKDEKLSCDCIVKGVLSRINSLVYEGNNIKLFPALAPRDWNKDTVTLKNIRTLYIQDTIITSLPSYIHQLKALQYLFINKNKYLENIDEGAFEGLNNLHHLTIKETEIEKIPKTILYLRNLKKLILSHNKIKSLPSSKDPMVLFTNLKELSVNDNKLNDIPLAYVKYDWPRLVTLNVRGNPLDDPAFLIQFLQQDNKINLRRIILPLSIWIKKDEHNFIQKEREYILNRDDLFEYLSHRILS